MPDSTEPRDLFARLVKALGAAGAAELLNILIRDRDTLEEDPRLQKFLRDNPSINAVFAEEIRNQLSPVVEQRFWVVRESAVADELELANLRKITAGSAKLVERYLRKPDDLDLIHGFRYAFQYRRLRSREAARIAELRGVESGHDQELEQIQRMIWGIQRRFERLKYGLNIRNLVTAGKLERSILPELTLLEEELFLEKIEHDEVRARVRAQFLSRIRFNEDEVFVSERSTDGELTGKLYERLVSLQVSEVTVFGRGRHNWERAKRISEAFVRENPEFKTQEVSEPGAWISGAVKISRVTPE